MQKCGCSISNGGRQGRPSDPHGKAAEKKAKPKGVIGRWLDKLAKVNEKEFGSKGPCCH